MGTQPQGTVRCELAEDDRGLLRLLVLNEIDREAGDHRAEARPPDSRCRARLERLRGILDRIPA